MGTLASLDDLPQELIDDVAHHLSRQDIFHLAQTCKELKHKTQEALYKHISMTWKGSRILENHKKECGYRRVNERPKTLSYPRIDLLLRTICEDTSLGARVATIDFQSDDYLNCLLQTRCSSKFTLTLPEVDRQTINTLRTMVRNLHTPLIMRLQLEEGIINEKPSAFVALLLWLCPKLVSLKLGIDLIWDNYYLRDLTQNCGFQNLKTVALGTINGDIRDSEMIRSRYPCGLDVRSYLYFLQCPDLMDFGIAHAFMPQNASGLTELSQTSQLTCLRLRKTFICPQTLTGLLTYFAHVTTLDYDHQLELRRRNAPPWGEYSGRPLDCVKLQAALEVCSGTLTHVRIGFRDNIIGIDGSFSWNLGARGLCYFHALTSVKSLHIPFSILADWAQYRHVYDDASSRDSEFANQVSQIWARLPCSLEHLALKNDFCDAFFVRGRLRLLDALKVAFGVWNWRTFVPELRRLDIYDFEDRDDIDMEENHADATQLCRDNGLESEIIDRNSKWEH